MSSSKETGRGVHIALSEGARKIVIFSTERSGGVKRIQVEIIERGPQIFDPSLISRLEQYYLDGSDEDSNRSGPEEEFVSALNKAKRKNVSWKSLELNLKRVFKESRQRFEGSRMGSPSDVLGAIQQKIVYLAQDIWTEPQEETKP